MTAVIYARYSSDNQREESIEGQIRECKAFAEKNDMHVNETAAGRTGRTQVINREYDKAGENVRTGN